MKQLTLFPLIFAHFWKCVEKQQSPTRFCGLLQTWWRTRAWTGLSRKNADSRRGKQYFPRPWNLRKIKAFPLIFSGCRIPEIVCFSEGIGSSRKNNKPRSESADYCRVGGEPAPGLVCLGKMQILGVERMIFLGRGICEKSRHFP